MKQHKHCPHAAGWIQQDLFYMETKDWSFLSAHLNWSQHACVCVVVWCLMFFFFGWVGGVCVCVCCYSSSVKKKKDQKNKALYLFPLTQRCSVIRLVIQRWAGNVEDGVLTWRPLPLDAWRLQRPRLPLGVVPQLLMICSCFSARSARSSSSSMNCCSRTLALASRAAVSWRNWSIWATSLEGKEESSRINDRALASVLHYRPAVNQSHPRAHTIDLPSLACGDCWHLQLSIGCLFNKKSIFII